MSEATPTQIQQSYLPEPVEIPTRSAHIELLARELEARKRRNPKYSLRAFAHHLGMDPAALSRILAGKQEISLRSAPKIASALHLDPETHQKFLDSVVESLRTRASEFLTAARTEGRARLTLVRPPQAPLAAGDSPARTPEVIRIAPEKVDEACRLIRNFAKSLEQAFQPSGEARSVEIQVQSV